MTAPAPPPDFRLDRCSIPQQLDHIAPGGRIGMIALATDFNIEQDLRRMLPQAVEMFTNRVMNRNPMTLTNLRTMADDIARAASGILPGLGVDVMIYGCTSGTVAIGYDNIVGIIQDQCPGIAITTPVSAATAALQAVGAKRISVLTPYIDEINRELGEFLQLQGFEVINVCGFGCENDIEVTQFPVEEIKQAAAIACAETADALFISCTAFRASIVIDAIEQQLGKPVISSNQALAWHALQLLNYKQPIAGFGSLLRLQR